MQRVVLIVHHQVVNTISCDERIPRCNGMRACAVLRHCGTRVVLRKPGLGRTCAHNTVAVCYQDMPVDAVLALVQSYYDHVACQYVRLFGAESPEHRARATWAAQLQAHTGSARMSVQTLMNVPAPAPMPVPMPAPTPMPVPTPIDVPMREEVLKCARGNRHHACKRSAARAVCTHSRDPTIIDATRKWMALISIVARTGYTKLYYKVNRSPHLNVQLVSIAGRALRCIARESLPQLLYEISRCHMWTELDGEF